MKLQVFLDNEWQYVLSRNSRTQLPTTTVNKEWAIDAQFCDYYQLLNPELQFKVV